MQSCCSQIRSCLNLLHFASLCFTIHQPGLLCSALMAFYSEGFSRPVRHPSNPDILPGMMFLWRALQRSEVFISKMHVAGPSRSEYFRGASSLRKIHEELRKRELCERQDSEPVRLTQLSLNRRRGIGASGILRISRTFSSCVMMTSGATSQLDYAVCVSFFFINLLSFQGAFSQGN